MLHTLHIPVLQKLYQRSCTPAQWVEQVLHLILELRFLEKLLKHKRMAGGNFETKSKGSSYC